jgi:hypothetical protein
MDARLDSRISFVHDEKLEEGLGGPPRTSRLRFAVAEKENAFSNTVEKKVHKVQSSTA